MLTFGTAAYLEDQQTFIDYVTSSSFNSDMEFKKMNEKIFNSSQDMWRTLNDRKFLDNVQEFYNARVVLEQQWKEWICFKKPVTNFVSSRMMAYLSFLRLVNLSDGGTPSSGTRWCSVFRCRARGASRAIR
ncbi:MAG: hypothetical protein IKQ59_06000 [Prevotella sp.]|nr:hypothetical protein [Prevotella sp.]